MATLYELTEQYRQLLELAEDPDTDPEVLADTLEGLDGEIEVKADGYAKVIAQVKSDIEGLKAEIDRLTNRKRAMENSIKRMKTSLQDAMLATGKRKFKTELFSFGIQKNPMSCVVEDVEHVPLEYRIPQPDKVDKKAIIAAYKAGRDVSGFAEVTQSEGVRIR